MNSLVRKPSGCAPSRSANLSRRTSTHRNRWALFHGMTDSPLGERGFEPSVPLYGELGALGRVRRAQFDRVRRTVGRRRLHGARRSSSHWTRRWREPDSNPRSPRVGELSCRAMNAERPRTSHTNSDAGAAAVHLDFFCSACHSMEPGAGGVLAGSGLRCCSAAWARLRMFSKNPWPGNGRLNQSRNCAVEST